MNRTYYKTKVNSCTTCQNGKKALPPPYLDAVMYIPSQLGEEQGALEYFKSFLTQQVRNQVRENTALHEP